jgi:hypothetical protein
VEIQGDQNIFDAFDFKDSGTIIFRGVSLSNGIVDVDINPSTLPEQTREIHLKGVEWRQKPIQPHDFPDLIELNLDMVDIDGTLGEYLSAPNLKHLHLNTIIFNQPDNTQSLDWTPLFSDTKFLQGAPVLETIKLEYQDINENFVKCLESCILLKSLALYCCDLSRFVSPFLERLESSELGSSLDTLIISNSWDPDPGMPFGQFRQRLMAKRPNVRLSDYY